MARRQPFEGLKRNQPCMNLHFQLPVYRPQHSAAGHPVFLGAYGVETTDKCKVSRPNNEAILKSTYQNNTLSSLRTESNTITKLCHLCYKNQRKHYKRYFSVLCNWPVSFSLTVNTGTWQPHVNIQTK